MRKNYEQALEQAFLQRPRAAKRGWDEDPKKEDEGMEDSEVPTLDPEQTVQFYRSKVGEGAKELARLEQGAKKEVIPVPQGPKRGEESKEAKCGKGKASRTQDGGSTGSGKQEEEEHQLAKTKRTEMELDVPKQQQSDGINGIALAKDIEQARRETQINIEIMLQEKMQLQQEQELEAVAKLAVVRKQAEEIEKRRSRPY